MDQKQKPWWYDSLVIFGRVSTWVTIPIVIALFVGKYLDRTFGTEPWMFLGLTALAFFISIFGILKVIKKYLQTIKDNDNQTHA
jgi:F0F1-type ATP synthase assembly protein I